MNESSFDPEKNLKKSKLGSGALESYANLSFERMDPSKLQETRADIIHWRRIMGKTLTQDEKDKTKELLLRIKKQEKILEAYLEVYRESIEPKLKKPITDTSANGIRSYIQAIEGSLVGLDRSLFPETIQDNISKRITEIENLEAPTIQKEIPPTRSAREKLHDKVKAVKARAGQITKEIVDETVVDATEIGGDFLDLRNKARQHAKKVSSGIKNDTGIIKNSVAIGSRDFMEKMAKNTSVPTHEPTKADQAWAKKENSLKKTNKGTPEKGIDALSMMTESHLSAMNPERKLKLEREEVPQKMSLRERFLAAKKAARRFQEGSIAGLGMMGEGHARAMNPERDLKMEANIPPAKKITPPGNNMDLSKISTPSDISMTSKNPPEIDLADLYPESPEEKERRELDSLKDKAKGWASGLKNYIAKTKEEDRDQSIIDDFYKNIDEATGKVIEKDPEIKGERRAPPLIKEFVSGMPAPKTASEEEKVPETKTSDNPEPKILSIGKRIKKLAREDWETKTIIDLKEKQREINNLLERGPDAREAAILNNFLEELELLIQEKENLNPKIILERKSMGVKGHLDEPIVAKKFPKKPLGTPDLVTGVVQPKPKEEGTPQTVAPEQTVNAKTVNKSKFPGPQPTNTLELGRRIRDIRRSKPRGFLLKNMGQDPAGAETADGSSGINKADLEKEIKDLSPKEREALEVGLHNIGFIVEKKKNEYFADTLSWIGSKMEDQKGTTARFVAALSTSYQKEADASDKRSRVNKKDARVLNKVASMAYLSKILIRPIALAAGAWGFAPGVAKSIVLGGAMLSGRITGSMKEARFANEEVLEKNRMAIDTAAKEAWEIYLRAEEEAGGKKVTAENLKKAYLYGLPLDLQQRLENTSVANGFFQGVFRRHIFSDVDLLNEDIKRIEENRKLSEKEKKIKKDHLISIFEKRLLDYDRALAQSGELDEYAMRAKYIESTSKNVARAMTALSLKIAAEKLFEGLANVVSSIDQDEIMESIKKVLPDGKGGRIEVPKPELIEITPNEPAIINEKGPVIDTSSVPEKLDQEVLVEQAKQKVEDQLAVTQETKPKLDPLHDVLRNKTPDTPPISVPGPENIKNETQNFGPDGQNYEFYNSGRTIIPTGPISPEIMRHAEAVYAQNIHKVFPENTEAAWDKFGSMPVKEILQASPENIESQGLEKLVTYVRKLEEVTGLKPKGRGFSNFFLRQESTEDFIRRAVNWARENGKMKEIEIR